MRTISFEATDIYMVLTVLVFAFACLFLVRCTEVHKPEYQTCIEQRQREIALKVAQPIVCEQKP
jgi:F0F1-type ATP synthase membrane subunit b/b'